MPSPRSRFQVHAGRATAFTARASIRPVKLTALPQRLPRLLRWRRQVSELGVADFRFPDGETGCSFHARSAQGAGAGGRPGLGRTLAVLRQLVDVDSRTWIRLLPSGRPSPRVFYGTAHRRREA